MVELISGSEVRADNRGATTWKHHGQERVAEQNKPPLLCLMLMTEVGYQLLLGHQPVLRFS
jgi:hypothetical protein